MKDTKLKPKVSETQLSDGGQENLGLGESTAVPGPITL